MVPPYSDKITRVPSYSSNLTEHDISDTGLSPSVAALSRAFSYDMNRFGFWAVPRSLAATEGISFDFSSYGYLDVSVPHVRLAHLCIQCAMTTEVAGFPHSEISG